MRYMTNTNQVNMMDQLFESIFSDNSAAVKQAVRTFPVDITEVNDEYIVSAELPGYTDGDVDITLNENLLVISASKVREAEKTTDKESKEKTDNVKKYLLRERKSGELKRSFSLPKDADREAIKATLEAGVLNLSIGKKPEAKPLSIKIN